MNLIFLALEHNQQNKAYNLIAYNRHILSYAKNVEFEFYLNIRWEN
jgi:hypothetical protein